LLGRQCHDRQLCAYECARAVNSADHDCRGSQTVDNGPEPDVSQQLPEPAWTFYSPQRLMEFEAGFYGRGCGAYAGALASKRRPCAIRRPARSQIYGDTRLGESSSLAAMRVPAELLDTLVADQFQPIWSSSRRVVITQAAQDEAANWGGSLPQWNSFIPGSPREPASKSVASAGQLQAATYVEGKARFQLGARLALGRPQECRTSRRRVTPAPVAEPRATRRR